MKDVLGLHGEAAQHWVGDGFPVRTLFSYDRDASRLSPFLLFDFAGPTTFEPTTATRGVGAHPHRGFETVTIVYQGEVEHRDSTGKGGVIGPGDVQWMTAGRGILHEEFHSPAYSQRGGPFLMIQLWVNLSAQHKMTAPTYQSLLDAEIPSLPLADGAGRARVIAGVLDGVRGPALTFSPINVWDVRLVGGRSAVLDFPEGHTAAVVVVSGRVSINGSASIGEAEMSLLSQGGRGARVSASEDAVILALSGEPIDEPVVGHGPFVMTSRAEIHQAIEDFRAGRFGQMVEA
jgi:redox-sensitive bicupin YhaK (pirin superfamily)